MSQPTAEQIEALLKLGPVLAQSAQDLTAAARHVSSPETPARRYVVPIIVAVLSAVPTGFLSAYVGMSVKQAELARDVVALHGADQQSQRERQELRTQVQVVFSHAHEAKERLAGVEADVRAHTRELDDHARRLGVLEGRRGTGLRLSPLPKLGLLDSLVQIHLSGPPATPPLLSAIGPPR